MGKSNSWHWTKDFRADWWGKRALNLRPFPTTSEMLDQLSDILRPLVPPSEVLSAEPARSVGGLSQVMVAESR